MVSTVSRSDDGRVYNVNADSAAAALAVALGAVKLVVLTDVAGLYRDWPTCEDFVSYLRPDELRAMLPGLDSGMLPKMEACLEAVDGGVTRAHVVDGRIAALRTGGGLHRHRHRHDGGERAMSLTQRWQSVMSDNYGTPAVTVVRGEGAVVWDADGKQYLDMVAGIAVNALGHAHPAVVEAVSQAGREPTVTPATWRSTRGEWNWPSGSSPWPGARAGSSSAIPVRRPMRRRSRSRGSPARHVVHAANGSFHGRTMGALSLTGQPPKRAPFEPLVAGVEFFDSVICPSRGRTQRRSSSSPSRGRPASCLHPTGYLAELAALEPLLIVDEVQTGIGRTGAWFAHQAAGVAPDMLTLAKGLGGGLPIGALLTFGQTADLLRPGHHGSTFGGNPIACAAALAVLDTIESDGLLAHVTALGSRIRSTSGGGARGGDMCAAKACCWPSFWTSRTRKRWRRPAGTTGCWSTPSGST